MECRHRGESQSVSALRLNAWPTGLTYGDPAKESPALANVLPLRAFDILDTLQSEPKEPRAIADKETNASGTTIVRMPKSLHEALVREAEVEGVSLNQLCVGKLAVQLSQAVGG
ncbi:MAG TPA: toxin-antitoxin system HicB family antitoxin [Pirellulales bacterium]|jgi:hypothetical protein|nr:toxin-antitoxin system HicB family antitoxin [Pirellulales bacterium]